MLGGTEAHQKMEFPSFEEDTALGVASTVFPDLCPPAPALAARCGKHHGLAGAAALRKSGSVRASLPVLVAELRSDSRGSWGHSMDPSEWRMSATVSFHEIAGHLRTLQSVSKF